MFLGLDDLDQCVMIFEQCLNAIRMLHKRCFLANPQQSVRYLNGALAEWLTRCPAKAISSEACVRITQASRFTFVFWPSFQPAIQCTLVIDLDSSPLSNGHSSRKSRLGMDCQSFWSLKQQRKALISKRTREQEARTTERSYVSHS